MRKSARGFLISVLTGMIDMSTKGLFDRLQPVFEDMGYCCASDGWRLHVICNTDGPRKKSVYISHSVLGDRCYLIFCTGYRFELSTNSFNILEDIETCLCDFCCKVACRLIGISQDFKYIYEVIILTEVGEGDCYVEHIISRFKYLLKVDELLREHLDRLAKFDGNLYSFYEVISQLGSLKNLKNTSVFHPSLLLGEVFSIFEGENHE